MRNVRAAVMPLCVLAAMCALAYFTLRVDVIARFDFIWDVVLGAALGAALALLPSLSGFGARKNSLTGMYWVCGFAALLLIFYQYMTSVTGMQFDSLHFLTNPGQRMRIVESAVLGYCSVIAGRGKA